MSKISFENDGFVSSPWAAQESKDSGYSWAIGCGKSSLWDPSSSSCRGGAAGSAGCPCPHLLHAWDLGSNRPLCRSLLKQLTSWMLPVMWWCLLLPALVLALNESPKTRQLNVGAEGLGLLSSCPGTQHLLLTVLCLVLQFEQELRVRAGCGGPEFQYCGAGSQIAAVTCDTVRPYPVLSLLHSLH